MNSSEQPGKSLATFVLSISSYKNNPESFRLEIKIEYYSKGDIQNCYLCKI